MPGPQIQLSMGSDALAKIGQYKEAAKVARKEVQQLQKEATKTSKLLGATHGLALQQTRAADDARKRLEGYQKQAKDALAPAHMAHDVKMYGKLAKAHAVKDLLSGEGGLQDVLLLAESRKLRKAAAKVGLGEVAGFLGKVAPHAILALITYEAVKHTVETVKRDKEVAREMGRAYGLGHITKTEFELYQKHTGWFKSNEEAKAEVEQMKGAGEAIGDLDSAKRLPVLEKAFEKGSKVWLWQSTDLKKERARDVNRAADEAVAAKSRELQRALTKEETKEIIEEVVMDAIEKTPGEKSEKEELVKLMKLYAKEAAEKNKPPPPTARDLYEKDREKKTRDYIAHARDKRFSAAESFGQVLWVGE